MMLREDVHDFNSWICLFALGTRTHFIGSRVAMYKVLGYGRREGMHLHPLALKKKKQGMIIKKIYSILNLI